jgi:two-component system nitrogen regulation sensor histidine kinase NtrY
LLSQALTNIVKNATEGIEAFGGDPGFSGRIDVTLTVAGEMVLIDVVDNGKGFPKDNRQRLLEPYMTTRAEGTGLGLPIVAKILADHGGGLELRDAPQGRGAWVRLFFPLRDETRVDSGGADPDGAPPKQMAGALGERGPVLDRS